MFSSIDGSDQVDSSWPGFTEPYQFPVMDMKKSRFTTEHIIGFIKQAEAGTAIVDPARQHEFSLADFYGWRAKHGGMEAEDDG